jgi:hypothetical protein
MPVPDIHVPKLETHSGGHSIFKLVLEVVLISVGVFLGLAGEQWRENTSHRELAERTLLRFRAEIVENRKAVADVTDYHKTLLPQLLEQLKLPPGKRSGKDIHFNGIRPATFEHAAWDLAIATQSLTYIDPNVALPLSNVYNVQDRVAELTRGMVQAMYFTPPALDEKNETAFLAAVALYYGDMSVFEPRLLQLYDDLMPLIDKALGKAAPL